MISLLNINSPKMRAKCTHRPFSYFPNRPAEKLAVFLKSLDDVIGEEKGMITLACEASKPRVSPTWRKEGKVLKAGPKYELLHTGKSLGLIIKDVTKDDAGEYSCDLGTEVSKAKVTVRGWCCCLKYTVLAWTLLVLLCVFTTSCFLTQM